MNDTSNVITQPGRQCQLLDSALFSLHFEATQPKALAKLKLYHKRVIPTKVTKRPNEIQAK
jgi:uncharacterized membrane protein